MNDPDIKKRVTNDDYNINIVTSLNEMKHVVGRLSSTINHLKEFVLEKVDDGIEKVSLLKRFS